VRVLRGPVLIVELAPGVQATLEGAGIISLKSLFVSH
jgi:hypothetical protein